MQIGSKQKWDIEDIMQAFPPVEGENLCYYGNTGSGKTYLATSDILELLRKGETVYANWQIEFDGFDERQSFWDVLISILFFRSTFFHYKKENFHYFDPDSPDLEEHGKLVNVHLFYDEGQWLFNSHVKDQDPVKRKLILHGRHHCRTLAVITQRPVNIFKDIRSQINVWYHCRKAFRLGNFILFKRDTIYKMKEDLPVENEEGVVQTISYVGRKRIFDAYNTHAMREKMAETRFASFDAYTVGFFRRILLLFYILWPFKRVRRDNGARARVETPPIRSMDGIK